jgi:hypothetical protein
MALSLRRETAANRGDRIASPAPTKLTLKIRSFSTRSRGRREHWHLEALSVAAPRRFPYGFDVAKELVALVCIERGAGGI